ncbi:hypothetical protein EVAR_37394_1 [Eumeta japonica]|uniref:Uncharacterized protein n=1 Tax=Eumeta variegata TaxID=151549 RepID=A0A4C1WGI9_EUMVA|nr:hypothetical protein EVAR_37394_1 [Eumeta japonica]
MRGTQCAKVGERDELATDRCAADDDGLTSACLLEENDSDTPTNGQTDNESITQGLLLKSRTVQKKNRKKNPLRKQKGYNELHHQIFTALVSHSRRPASSLSCRRFIQISAQSLRRFFIFRLSRNLPWPPTAAPYDLYPLAYSISPRDTSAGRLCNRSGLRAARVGDDAS